MIEVEAKARITEGEYRGLRKNLASRLGFPDKTRFTDYYYAFKPNGVSIRLRVDGRGEGRVTLKHKKRSGSLETNREKEVGIANPDQWKRRFASAGCKPVAIKHKSVLRFKSGHLTLELVKVRRLGPFLEIERLVRTPDKVKTAQREVEAMFRELGIPKSRFERKYYLELLQELE